MSTSSNFSSFFIFRCSQLPFSIFIVIIESSDSISLSPGWLMQCWLFLHSEKQLFCFFFESAMSFVYESNFSWQMNNESWTRRLNIEFFCCLFGLAFTMMTTWTYRRRVYFQSETSSRFFSSLLLCLLHPNREQSILT